MKKLLLVLLLVGCATTPPGPSQEQMTQLNNEFQQLTQQALTARFSG